jgi:hypothetical protein
MPNHPTGSTVPALPSVALRRRRVQAHAPHHRAAGLVTCHRNPRLIHSSVRCPHGPQGHCGPCKPAITRQSDTGTMRVVPVTALYVQSVTVRLIAA